VSQVRGDGVVGPAVPAAPRPARLPKYYGVKRQLLELTRALAPGTALAPERELAARYGTSRTTIRQALAELAVEGRLLRIQGRARSWPSPR
jgi:GntR family transcriptional regulator